MKSKKKLPPKQNLIELIEQLKKPNISEHANLKDLYAEAKGKIKR